MSLPELSRLVSVMQQTRQHCPWDANQTHLSLVRYLIEETLEVVDAIETGDDESLVEELGDLLLQVVFHAEIASESDRFDIEDVAKRIADKLVARHPYVFADEDVPNDLVSSWEQAKAVEKARSSVLDGIPDRMSALLRAQKVIGRAFSHGFTADQLGLATSDATDVGTLALQLAARATELDVDAEQLLRAAVKDLEGRIGALERSASRS